MRLGLSRRTRVSVAEEAIAASAEEAAVLDWMADVMASVEKANTMLVTPRRREAPAPPEPVIDHQLD